MHAHAHAHTYACPVLLIPKHVTWQTWDQVTLPASEAVSPAQWKLRLGPPMEKPLKPLITPVPFSLSHKCKNVLPITVCGFSLKFLIAGREQKCYFFFRAKCVSLSWSFSDRGCVSIMSSWPCTVVILHIDIAA